MGNLITLDSDDVECLLLAAAIPKEIEARILSVGRDPTMMRRQGDIEAAFNRINVARSQAGRESRDPEYNDPLTANMAAVMQAFRGSSVIHGLSPTDPIISGLVRRRMIVAGTQEVFVKWGDKTVTVHSEPVILHRITDRGMRWLQENNVASIEDSSTAV